MDTWDTNLLDVSTEEIDLSLYNIPDIDIIIQDEHESTLRMSNVAIELDSWSLSSNRICISGVPFLPTSQRDTWVALVSSALEVMGLVACPEQYTRATTRGRHGGMTNIGDGTGDLFLSLTETFTFGHESKVGVFNRVTTVEVGSHTLVVTGVPQDKSRDNPHTVAVLRGCPTLDGPAAHALTSGTESRCRILGVERTAPSCLGQQTKDILPVSQHGGD